MNIYFAEPSLNKLSASHIYAWKLGMKTGQYYLRSRPARDAIQFTLDVDNLEVTDDKKVEKNLSKAEMDENKRQIRKRKATDANASAETKVLSISQDLNKKRKVSETASVVVTDGK
jgi:ribonucleotide reductase alpha subunit